MNSQTHTTVLETLKVCVVTRLRALLGLPQRLLARWLLLDKAMQPAQAHRCINKVSTLATR